MEAAADERGFWIMSEEKVRRWVEANPGCVNDRDRCGRTPLYAAVELLDSSSLVQWLLDEKGADINGRTKNGAVPLHTARFRGVLSALLDRDADPIVQDAYGTSPLMNYARWGSVIRITRLLQDPRVRAAIDMQDHNGRTALHHACDHWQNSATSTVDLLLEARPNPRLVDKCGQTPLAFLREKHPTYHATIVLLEQAPEAEKASLLVKARRLATAAASGAIPSCLQGRLARGQRLPRVTLTPVTSVQSDGEDDKESRKLHTLVEFLLGMAGSPKGEGMPRDVFRVVLDLVMPFWDPLRRGVVGDGQLQLG